MGPSNLVIRMHRISTIEMLYITVKKERYHFVIRLDVLLHHLNLNCLIMFIRHVHMKS